MFFKKKSVDEKSPIKVGQLLHLEATNDDDGSNKVYKSRIADIQGESIAIEIPIDEDTGRMYGFPISTEFMISFVDTGGVKYAFKTNVTGKSMDNIPLLMVNMPQPDKIRKIQRRDFLRVPANLKLTITPQDKVESAEGTTVDTVDIGGGGVAIALAPGMIFNIGEELVCLLKLPGRNSLDAVPFLAKVVRVIPPNERQREQMIGLQISEIQERDREKIIRYCFQREMELRKY